MRSIIPLLITAGVLTACAAALPTGDDPTGIEGMSPADVIGAMEEMGIECSEPEKGLVHIGFFCVGTTDGVHVSGISNTIDEMYEVEIDVAYGNRQAAERLTRAVMSIPYQGSDADAALAFMAERLDSSACGEDNKQFPTGCQQAVGAAIIVVQQQGSAGTIRISVQGGSPPA